MQLKEVMQSYLSYWWLISSEFVVKIDKPCTNVLFNNFSKNGEIVSMQIAITIFCYSHILHKNHGTLATLINLHNVLILLFQMCSNGDHILILKIRPICNHELLLWISWFVPNLDFCLTTNSNHNNCQRSTCIFIEPL
jgi:hypothetical protein